MKLELHRQETVAYVGKRGLAMVILRRCDGGPDHDDNPPRLYLGVHETRDLAVAAALDEARAYDSSVTIVSSR